MKKAFLFGLLFCFLAFFPYAVIDKFDAYLDSRYYYASVAGMSIVFGIAAQWLLQTTWSVVQKRFVLSIIWFFILSHAFFLFYDLYKQAQISQERKSIIRQVVEFVPKLSHKTVFFVTGNSPGYYGIVELKVPFQSGLGQVLLTEYVEKKQADPALFKEETLQKTLDAGFLYDTLAQGYKQSFSSNRNINGQGFGYYYEKVELEEQIKNGKFAKKDVVSLFYNSDTKTIRKMDILQ